MTVWGQSVFHRLWIQRPILSEGSPASIDWAMNELLKVGDVQLNDFSRRRPWLDDTIVDRNHIYSNIVNWCQENIDKEQPQMLDKVWGSDVSRSGTGDAMRSGTLVGWFHSNCMATLTKMVGWWLRPSNMGNSLVTSGWLMIGLGVAYLLHMSIYIYIHI